MSVQRPLFIPLSLEKFQVCCSPGCGRDAILEYQGGANLEEQFFFAACAIHDKAMAEAAEMLSSGTRLTILGRRSLVDLKEIFVSPPSYTQKCRWTAWQEWLKSQNPTHTQSHNPAHVVKATLEWSWPLNRDRWRTVEGELVTLGGLRLAEFLSAVQQIVEANYPILPRQLAWTKKLTPPAVFYVYPEEEICVDREFARDKLDDMRSEAKVRGLL